MPRREWLVTNGLGGYASGTVAGVVTRRYHGLLIAALPAPFGRYVMLNHLLERVRLPSRRVTWLGDEDEVAGPNAADRRGHLVEFRLELGLPVWRYEVGGFVIEKRVVMPHGQNTVHVSYTLSRAVRAGMSAQPAAVGALPSYEAPVSPSAAAAYTIVSSGTRHELTSDAPLDCRRCGCGWWASAGP